MTFMIKYILMLCMTTQLWALTTIARVGEVYVTDYDVQQTQKVVSWLGNTQVSYDKLASYAKDATLHASQVYQVAKQFNISLNQQETDYIIESQAKHSGLTVDQLKKKILDMGVEWPHFVNILQLEILEKRLVFMVYRSRISPTSSDLEDELKKIKLSNPIDISVLTAPLGTKVTKDSWQDKTNDKLKVVDFNGYPIAHLPDAYQEKVLTMKTGDTSEVFTAMSMLNQIKVIDYKAPEMDVEAVKESIMLKNLVALQSEWKRFLTQNFAIEYL